MVDIGVPLTLTGENRPDAKTVWSWVARGEVAMALGIIGVIMLLIVPAPPIVLDLLLAMSITSAVLILMTAVLIKKPLEFSAFPTVLLVTTLYRLGLNIASARLILSHGHEGTEAAGHVIQSFGQLMMQGDFVIGVIVFAILVVVNFVVITKGSTRIAEVAARFTLDSMPGKQMAIDADLSTGLIDETEAKRRRKELELESTFFGAMDGASKFVRGDAVAGLIITGINIVGGILIGVVQHHVPIAQAASTYTVMTIGDGLVSQVPALVISIAAGFLVSKAGVEGSADKAIVAQLGMNPVSLGMVSAASGVIAFVPGMPIIPFAAIAAGSGLLAWRRAQNQRTKDIDAAKPKPPAAAARAGRGADHLGPGHRRRQDRAGLRPAVADQRPGGPPPHRPDPRPAPHPGGGLRLRHAAGAHPRQHAPGQPGLRHPHQGDGERRGRGAAGHAAGHGPARPGGDLPGEHVREPAFGLPATWVDDGLREEAAFRGYTIVDPATVLTTHLTEILKDNMADLLSYAVSVLIAVLVAANWLQTVANFTLVYNGFFSAIARLALTMAALLSLAGIYNVVARPGLIGFTTCYMAIYVVGAFAHLVLALRLPLAPGGGRVTGRVTG